MTEDNPNSFIHTNVRVFYKIAQEAYVMMSEDINSRRRKKPGNEPGYIITYDPNQTSFKNAFIVIVFSGVFLESILHLLIVKQKGIKAFEENDRKLNYESKFKLLGCDDESIMDLCKNFRAARREVVHEKAHLDSESFRNAQKEAKSAIELVNKVVAYFNLEIS